MTFSQWRERKRKQTEGEQSGVAIDTQPAQPQQTAPETDRPLRFSQWRKQHENSHAIPRETVQDWAQASSTLIDDMQTASGSWFDASVYEASERKLSGMLSQADRWRTMYADNAKAIEAIDSVADALNRTKDYMAENLQHYAQWDSAEDYHSDYQAYQDLLNFNVEAGEKELDGLWEFYDKADTIESWYTDYSTSAPESRVDPETDAANMVIYNELVAQYGTLADLRALIQEKELYLTRSKRAKEKDKLVSVANPNSENYDPNFEANSAYVSTAYDDPTWDLILNNQYLLGYADLTYEYINGGQNGMREKIEQTHKDLLLLNPLASIESDFEKNNYRFIQDHEIALYNYYYATEGKESAQRYLNLIQETLNQRAAAERFEQYKDNTFGEIVFGAEAGLEQFTSGVKNFFDFDADYIPVSDTQILSGMVREDLADDNIPVWYNFKTGQWEEQVFGSSAGQMAYDTVNTTANVLPTVLVSAAVNYVAPGLGSVVGAGLSGISAAGNAYQEMLNLGYDKGQARAYSSLVGASEAGLSYLLSGISKLGGEFTGHFIQNAIAGVDNAFGRIAIKLGSNMISEGFEEGLTELLTPWFQNITLHTNEKANWGQIAYAGLMGALTANLFEGSGTIKENVGYYRTGKALKEAGISGKQVADLGKILSNEAVNTLAQRVDETTGAYTVGRLFGEIGASLTDTNRADITAALADQGVRNKDAKILTNAIADVMEGARLTQQQIQILEANDVLAQTVLDVLSQDTDLMQKNQQYREIRSALETGTNLANPEVQRQLAELANSTDVNGGERLVLDVFRRRTGEIASLQARLWEQQDILTKMQKQGASALQQIPTKNRIKLLTHKLAREQKDLLSLESAPGMQQLLEKLRQSQTPETSQVPEIAEVPDSSKSVENNSQKAVENIRTYVRINTDGNIITDGSHIENGKLRPNVTYQTGEHAYLYATNADGLIVEVFVEKLQEKTHEKRLRHNPNTYGKQAGDHAGHLIGDRFGGSPELDNLVSQATLVNKSKYAKIENQWAAAIKAGKDLSVSIAVNYDGGTRPTSFEVRYSIDGGKVITKTIKNN